MIKNLTQSENEKFIAEVKNYDPDMLFPLRPQDITSEIIDAFVIPRLHIDHNNKNNCILCFLMYVFQRIGRSDIADEVRQIRSRMH